MLVRFSEHSVDPDDSDGACCRLSRPGSTSAAGLLPDGPPYGGDMDNGRRIEGVAPRNELEADARVWAYMRHGLHKEARIARTRRDSTGLHDTPEAYKAIGELRGQNAAMLARVVG